MSRRRRTVRPAITIIGLGLLLVACGAEESDAEARFPANQDIGPMRLHVPQEWEEFPVESSDEGDVVGFSEAQDGTAERYVMTRTDFQGASSVSSANGVMSADVQFRGGQQEEPQQIDIAGADVAWSADLTWPGDRGDVTARYWIAQDDESGIMAAAEYGGYGMDAEELDAYEETLELVPEAGE